MKKIKVGIIGQGRSGRGIHCEYLSQMTEQYEITAVCDLIQSRLDSALIEYNCDTYLDYHSLMERKDLDLIVNALPSHLHVPVTLELIHNGFNVLCEKPLARHVSEVDTLIEASQKSGKVFAIFQQSRYAPYYLKVKEIIDSGVIGRPVQISCRFNGFSRRWDWQTLQDMNGGSLLNTGPHPLDQALQFLNFDGMPDVTCYMDRCNSYGDAEDFVKLLLHAPNRPLIDLEISSCDAYNPFTYHVQGAYGSIKGTMEHFEWKYFKPEESPEHKATKEPLVNKDGAPGYCIEDLKWYEEKYDVPKEESDLFKTIATRYYEMLYTTLTAGTPLEVTHKQVRQQIAVIEECHRQNPFPTMNL